tara:strand:- start:497 stop:1141 length:645 start_codon:yes stop_codon:yes gene_type:complete
MINNQGDIINDLHTNCIDFKSREIYLHNYFGSADTENPGVEYKMSNIFLKNLRVLELKSQDPIIIHMNSIGGEWSDGMAIFDAIRMCNSYVTIISYGQVESMSSIILQAADYRLITTNSYFMCHYGSSGIAGDYLSAQNWINYEKYICDTMLNIYSNKCFKGQFFKEKYVKPDEAKVKNFLSKKLKDGDWYMTSEECVYYGFADKVAKDWKQLT